MKFSNLVFSALLLSSVSLVHANGIRGGRVLRPLQESCLAVVGVVEYGDGTPEVTRLDCETPSGMHYNVPVTEAWIKEKMANGILKSGSSELDMPGASVDQASGKIVLPENATPDIINRGGGPNRDLRELAVTGTRTVLVVRVVASNDSTGFTEAQLSDSVFGTSGDAVNLKSQYDACSHGQLIFDPVNDRDKVSGGADSTHIRFGTTTVNVATATSEGDTVMMNAIASALNWQFGVSSPSALANHVMYCLPPATMSGIAWAYINHWNSLYSNQWCTYPSAQMHEIGHNINLAHSNEAGDYKDQTGMMGYSYSNTNTQMCFNGAKLWQLGWFSGDDALLLNENDLMNPVTVNLEGFVKPIQNGDGKTKVIKLNGPTSTDLYVAFNWKTLHNAGTVEGGDQVTIVEQGGEGNGYSFSELRAKLSAGASFTRTGYFGADTDLTVTVDAIDTTTGEATITISTTLVPECTVDVDCNDNLACNGVETCSNGSCIAGSPVVCTGTSTCGALEVCSEPTGTCVTAGSGEDGICDLNNGETCSACPGDCTDDFSTSQCGNGVCEDNEDCSNCPSDCAGQTSGNPNNRFCCAGGPSGTCSDSRCGSCDVAPATMETSCCGDGVCEGNEATDCPSDCPVVPTPAPPSCDYCSETNAACCGTCVTWGPKSQRGCFV